MTMKLIGACGLAAVALAGASVGAGFSPAGAVASGTTTTATTATTATTTTTGRTTVEDVSGPCDEAEHGNDPRCTGAPANTVKASGKHRRGKGKGRSGSDPSGNDRSGSNSGRG